MTHSFDYYPIESAPRDGTEIMVQLNGVWRKCTWHENSKSWEHKMIRCVTLCDPAGAKFWAEVKDMEVGG